MISQFAYFLTPANGKLFFFKTTKALVNRDLRVLHTVISKAQLTQVVIDSIENDLDKVVFS